MIIETTLENFDWNMWGYHFPISAEATELLASEDHKRVVCTINDQITQQCALMPIDGGSYILINKRNRDKLGLKEGDSVTLKVEKDTTEYGLPVPESFRFVMEEDAEAFEHFKKLTPGKQRSLLYIVNKVKSTDKQVNKALAIAAHLRDVNGQLDFKLFNIKIKEFNQKDKLR